MKHSTRWKMRLVAGIMIFLSLAAGVLIANLYENYYGDVCIQELKRLLTIARANSSNVQLYLTERIERLRLLGTDGRVASMLRENDVLGLDLLVRHYGELDDNLEALYLIDTDGECRADYLRYPCADTWDMQEVLHTIPLQTEGIASVFQTDSCRWAIAITSSILSQGKCLGVVAGIVTVDAIYDEQLKYVRVGSNGYVTIQDMDGTILYHPNTEWVGKNLLTLAQGQPDDFAYLAHSQYHKERGKAIYADALPLTGEDAGRMKLQAYCRANVGPHFFVVSAVLNYEETIAVTRDNLAKAQLLIVLYVFILGACAILLLLMRGKQQKLLVEAKYLAEMNTMLRELNNSNEQIRHYQKMQTIGTFTSGIAHELRNLLTPILGFSEILMQYNHDDPLALDNATEIHIAALRAQDMIEQLLLFGRRDKGRQKTMNVCETLLASAKMVRMMLPQNVELQVCLSDDVAYVLGSKSQLHQCIVNLCKNAYQAMGETGGTIRLTERTLTAQELSCGRYADAQMEEAVEIAVSDSGSGMEPETLEQVFDPFFTTKNGVEGTGLGLSLVRDIITRHSGKIYAFSEVGKGSEFVLLLPKVAVGLDIFAAVEEQTVFLVVCESTQSACALQKAIAQKKSAAEAFDDPKKALDCLRCHPGRYCMLITDYALSGMTGNALAHAARCIRNDLPVILMTHLVRADMLWLSMDGCVDQILTKPLPFETLWDCAEQLLKGGTNLL